MTVTPTPTDIDAYLNRIGHGGATSATLLVLRELVVRHTASIPFENLDPLLRDPVRLKPAALWSKLVASSRGGYCFEHNTLFLHVLTGLGFRVAPLLARVLWGRDQTQPAPRTHMLLRVELADGSYIADVGFGGVTPTGPLALLAGAAQVTPHEAFRLLPDREEYRLQVELAGGWTDVYRFHARPVLLVDCEPLNWYHSTCPESPFTQRLMAARVGAEGRHTLLNSAYALHGADGGIARQRLADADAVLELLGSHFGILMHPGKRRDAIRRRLAEVIAVSPD